VAGGIESFAEIHDGKKRNKKKAVVITRLGTRNAGAVHRLALAFRRVGSFFTRRDPGGGTVFGDGAPIVKMALSLLPVPGVCGVDVPNGPAGVCGAPPPRLNVKPCCTAGDVGCPPPEPNPNGFGAGCCAGALVGPANGNGVDGAGANCCAPNAGLAGADPNAPPLAGGLNVNGAVVAGC
jgi:hypothetical protein